MMALLKIARIASSNGLDSFIDSAGYAACGGENGQRMKEGDLYMLYLLCAIFFVGWLLHFSAAATLIVYMMEKGYDLPSKEEAAKCCLHFWDAFFHLK